MNPFVIIIIVNWNGKNDTVECLDSAKRINYPRISTIVVDNGSTDGSQEAIKDHYPEITLIETGENLGYAEGNNVGIRKALQEKADYIFLLNNDAIIAHDTIREMVRFAESDNNIGIIAPKILYYNDPTKIWFAGGIVDFINGAIHRRAEELDTAEEETIDIDYATGCAIMIKSEVINKIGLLRPEFFLLFEETDWCARAREAGYRVCYTSKAKVWHKCSSSFGGERSPLWIYYYVRNNLLYIRYHTRGICKFKAYYHVLRRFYNRQYIKEFTFNRLNVNAVVIGIADFLLKRYGRRRNVNFSDSLYTLLKSS